MKEKNLFYTIAFCVIAIHGLIFFLGFLWDLKTETQIPQTKLQVHVIAQTIQLGQNDKIPLILEEIPSENLSETAVTPLNGPTNKVTEPPSLSSSAPETPIKPKPVSQKKIESQKKEEKKAPKKDSKKNVSTKNPPPAAKKDPSPSHEKVTDNALKIKQQQLLAQAKESIAKIDTKHATLTSAQAGGQIKGNIPKTISSLASETLTLSGSAEGTFKGGEASYVEELISRIRLALQLPEYGEVKIRLTLNRSGAVEQLVVIHAKSKINQKYIETHLPNILFSSFGNQFGSQSCKTFTLTLSNE